ncbi:MULTISPECIES: hypothetical protein [Roseobacteraceae]|nr:MULTISPECIES: hypothetical protein [Roseobacteraceae]MCA0996563.1 hypothetical protein [Alloyangia pacifica]NDV98016.1 hypothetical protein [Salipiger sp. PrR002]NDW56991.1 hypothetical protein [Salipiger sp. PrR004]
MIAMIRTTVTRAQFKSQMSSPSLVGDMIGALSLVVILVGALHLPLL